jgi:peroxiredoxin Q/BCP
VLLGITFSPPEDLKAWAEESGLTTDLLFDSNRSVAMAYGAAESFDQERATRLSVLIGPDGKVVKVYAKPDPDTHPAEVLRDLD